METYESAEISREEARAIRSRVIGNPTEEVIGQFINYLYKANNDTRNRLIEPMPTSIMAMIAKHLGVYDLNKTDRLSVMSDVRRAVNRNINSAQAGSVVDYMLRK